MTELRIGHEERDAACRALDEHLAAGRLDADEYADRYASAMNAHIQSEIDALFVDLPQPHPAMPSSAPLPPPATPARGPWTRGMRTFSAVPLALRVAVIAGIIVMLVGTFSVVPVLVLIWFVVLPALGVRPGRRCHSRWR